MPIGGLVVSCGKGWEDRVMPKILELPGVEVHGSNGKGDLVVVVEAETSNLLETVVEAISRVDGVLTVGMTYLNFEDESNPKRPAILP